MASIFTFDIATQTLNGAVAPSTLTDEIRASDITIAVLSVSDNGQGLLAIEFKADLSASEEATLTQVVANHAGRLGINDPEKFVLSDINGDPVSIIDDGQTRRIAFSLDNTITGPQGEKGDTGDTGPQGPQGDPGPVSVFGSEYNLAESLNQSTNGGSNFVTKVTLNVTGLPSGTYRLNWFYRWAMSNTGDDFQGNIVLDGSDLFQHRQEAKDAGNDQRHPASGFVPNLSLSGDHTFLIEYRPEDNEETAFISDARLELWRVL